MPRSPWMGESGALGNTHGYSTHSESPSGGQILDRSYSATDETVGLGPNDVYSNSF